MIFSSNNATKPDKWKRIVNAAFRNKVSFDILIPRAERAKHSCYYNFLPDPVVLSTNFFYLSGFQNENCNQSITISSQVMFITAFLNSCFGQIQFEIHSNNQEGDYIINEDITKIDLDTIPSADIIIGGPPCQGFSGIGKRNPNDNRSALVYSFLEVVDKVQPKIFLFENVTGIKSSKAPDGSKVVDNLKQSFEGYPPATRDSLSRMGGEPGRLNCKPETTTFKNE